MVNNIPAINPQKICEDLLRKRRIELIESSTRKSNVEIIDKLLKRGLELKDAYQELYKKLHDHPQALDRFFEILLHTTAYWNPESNLKAIQKKARLEAVNREISIAAENLSNLLNERSDLDSNSGFYCDTFTHIAEAIDSAGANNYSYNQWIKEKINDIAGQFDTGYWPTLAETVQAIGENAAQAKAIPHDSMTKAGTDGDREGLPSSFRAFFAAIEQSSARTFDAIPRDFEITDRSVAALMSCALGRDEVLESSYVKRLRQRERERRENQ